MKYMKDDLISSSEIESGIEISDVQYTQILEAKIEGKKVEVRNGQPFIYSLLKRNVYRLVDNIVESLEIWDDDITPDGYQDTEPTPVAIDFTTASKLSIIDYFDSLGGTALDDFFAIIESDVKRNRRWVASQNIDINDPMVPVVRDAMGWTQQQLQDLFNALNA